MPSTNGKIYYGASLVAEPSVQWDGTLNTYTIPGSLIQTFTTSGTFTPPVGVTVVHVLVVGGGAVGQTARKGPSGWAYIGGFGGWGAVPAYYPNVAVGGAVAVTIGGSGTASSFGGLVGPAGAGTAPGLFAGGSPVTWDANTATFAPPNRNGGPGALINGTYYGLGGYGGNAGYLGSAGSGGNNPPAAVAGGTGKGGTGGNGNGTTGVVTVGGLGGSGVVLIYSEQV